MNITEANSYQRLLAYLFDQHRTPEQEEQARTAAVYLAGRSRQALGAGMGEFGVEGRWVGLMMRCAGCPACEPATARASAEDVA